MNKRNRMINLLIFMSMLISILMAPIGLTTQDNEGFCSHSSSPEWYDGTFQGQIRTTDQNQIGTIIGTIQLGRSDTIGSFTASWSTDQSSGQARGRFAKHILFGIFKQNDHNLPFFGSIEGQEDSFSARCVIPTIGTYFINGTYDTTFMYPLTGPYNIGVQDFHLIDSSRPEYFTEDNPDDKREMMMRIWYPTDAEQSEYTPVEYMDFITFQWLKDRSPIPLITIPDDAYLFADTHATFSPPLYTNDAPYPLIMFSHGYDGVYQIYTSLIEDLVSNGYIIASINHPYIAGVTVFPGDRSVYVSQIPLDDQGREEWLSIGHRSVVDDIQFGLDVLTEMNNNDSFFAGTMDLSQVGVYGHSFGGGATVECCNEDPRFKAGLTLDGFFTSDTITEGFTTPLFMMVTGGRYESDTTLPETWDRITQNAYLIGIQGSEHYSYTDVGVLLEHLLPRIPAELLGFGSIDQKRMINITISLEKAFFNAYLKQTSTDALTDLLTGYPEISYMVKE